MKNKILFTLLLFSIINLQAQDSITTKLDPGKVRDLFPSKPTVELIQSYNIPNQQAVFMKMNYGAHQIIHPEKWKNGKMDKRPRSVELIMTLHPSDQEKWNTQFHTLIGNRIIEIYKLDSVFLLDKTIKWKIVLQNKASTNATAAAQIHGIVIKYDNLLTAKEKEHYKTILNKFIVRNHRAMTNVDKLESILDRNIKKWKKMLIITDCTGSMEPYGAEVALWHLLHLNKEEVCGFTFFNDGNGIDSAKKTIGNTGGIFHSQTKNGQQIIDNIRMATIMGRGNYDTPENDLEAIIKSTQEMKEFNDVILIADNNSGIRDIELIEKIKVPIRIVICGLGDQGINIDYIKLAYHTKGTIHTIKEDIETLIRVKEGETFKIDNQLYKIDSGEILYKGINKKT